MVLSPMKLSTESRPVERNERLSVVGIAGPGSEVHWCVYEATFETSDDIIGNFRI